MPVCPLIHTRRIGKSTLHLSYRSSVPIWKDDASSKERFHDDEGTADWRDRSNGLACADLLLKQPEFEVTALVRRHGYALAGARVVEADLKNDFSHAFQGISHVIYAAGSAESEGAAEEEQVDRDAVARAAEYALAYNAQKLVVISSLSAYRPELGRTRCATIRR